MWELVASQYGKRIKVFGCYIPYSIKVAEQSLYGKSIIEQYPDHQVSMAYKNIAKELIDYGK